MSDYGDYEDTGAGVEEYNSDHNSSNHSRSSSDSSSHHSNHSRSGSEKSSHHSDVEDYRHEHGPFGGGHGGGGHGGGGHGGGGLGIGGGGGGHGAGGHGGGGGGGGFGALAKFAKSAYEKHSGKDKDKDKDKEGHPAAGGGFAPYQSQGAYAPYQGAPAGNNYGGFAGGGSGEYGARQGGGDGYGGGHGYQAPPGPPPSDLYYPTAAGYNPGNAYPQGMGMAPPPERFGQQNFHQADGREQGQIKQYFEYSNCRGDRKALLIGINYFGSSSELAGCINDVHNVKRFICERFGYNPSDIVVLTDDARDPRMIPTKDNIMSAMAWLVSGAKTDDALFFHYSGHGTQAEDVDGDEGDDDDEAICPVDYKEAGLIVDDDSESVSIQGSLPHHDRHFADIAVYTMLVKPLPAGCRLTAIFDSCHSGTVMDLPYVYTTDGKIKEPNLLAGARKELLGAAMGFMRGDTAGGFTSLFGAAKGAYEENAAHEKTKETKTSSADVIMFSGCKDDQTSADTQEAGKATGAMSFAFIAALTKYPRQSYQQLLSTVRAELRGKYSQKPQLSACHPIDTELEFVA